MSETKKKMNKSKIKLTKFERTRLLSARALEIANGSEPKIDVSKLDSSSLTRDYVKIAQLELNENKLNLEIYKK